MKEWKFILDPARPQLHVKCSQIVKNYVINNLLKFQIDSFKIDPWWTYVKIKVKKQLPGPLDTRES